MINEIEIFPHFGLWFLPLNIGHKPSLAFTFYPSIKRINSFKKDPTQKFNHTTAKQHNNQQISVFIKGKNKTFP